MPVSEVVVDVSEWNRHALEWFLRMVDRVDDHVSRSPGKEQSWAYEDEANALFAWERQWKRDLRRFLELNPNLSRRVRDAFAYVSVYVTHRSHITGEPIWTMPGINGLEHHEPGKYPPTLAQLVKEVRITGRCSQFHGLGAKAAKEIAACVLPEEGA